MGAVHDDGPIFHIASEQDWRRAQREGSYAAPSLEQEGFIHLSTPAQVVSSAQRHYAGRDDLVLLVIAPDALTAELRRERSRHHRDPFPHLYGRLNLEAVRRVVPFPRDRDGEGFTLPPEALHPL
jgi:uncharacterized protein (DUF952 family)